MLSDSLRSTRGSTKDFIRNGRMHACTTACLRQTVPPDVIQLSGIAMV
jgi:hypothetical protein